MEQVMENSNPEEGEQEIGAALALCYMKNAVLHEDISSKLRELRRKYLLGQQHDCKIPETCPFTNLKGFVGRHSEPIEKRLTRTDLAAGQHRLNLGKADVKMKFLPFLEREGGDVNRIENGIGLKVYDDVGGKAYTMTFKLWTGKSYVLTSGWRKFYEEHELRENEHSVRVWLFKKKCTKDGKFCCLILSEKTVDKGKIARG